MPKTKKGKDKDKKSSEDQGGIEVSAASQSVTPLDSEQGGALTKHPGEILMEQAEKEGAVAEGKGYGDRLIADKEGSPIIEFLESPKGEEETFSFEEEGEVTDYGAEEKDADIVEVSAPDKGVKKEYDPEGPGFPGPGGFPGGITEFPGGGKDVEGIPGLPEGPGSPEFPGQGAPVKGTPETPDGGPKSGGGKEPLSPKKIGGFWKSYGVVGVKGSSTGGEQGDLGEKKEYGNVASDRGKGHISKGKGTWGALGSVDV